MKDPLPVCLESDVDAGTGARLPSLKLSICITTLNRAKFIGGTLESILNQAEDGYEVVVLDAGSTDGTDQVVAELARRFDRLRYIEQGVNNGIDRDYDRAIEVARGEYCWLMTDDDILKPGAVRTVLNAIRHDVSLVVVNVECMNFTMDRVLQRRFIDVESDRMYEPGEMDRLLEEVGEIFQYIGLIVIRREIWIAREKERYFGTLFVYLGVIFQARLPGKVHLVAEPLISYRWGNLHTFASKWFETVMMNYPRFIWSLPLSDYAKRQVVFSPEPWKSARELVLWRAWDLYSIREYRLLLRLTSKSVRSTLTCAVVALIPGVLANAMVVSYYSLTRSRYRRVWSAELVLHGLRSSRFYPLNWLAFKQKSSYIEG